MTSFKRYFAGLSVNTFLLAFASLFADVSTEMLYPVLPIFLTQILEASPSILGPVLGLVEGVAEGTQNVVQGFSGWLSDRLQRRKPIALVGYVVAALAKPLIGLSTAWTGVLGGRALDRLASGTRSAPRDALVAASADEAHRGKAFGLEGIGDNLGAFLGPLVTLALLALFAVELHSIFLFAFIPGVLAALMILLVRERSTTTTAKAKLDMNVRRFPRAYWTYLLVIAIFGIGNSSNAFLILRTKDLIASHMPEEEAMRLTIVIYAFFNLVAALASYPAGYLSDHIGRKRVLLVAFLVFLLVYSGFGLLENAVGIGLLFVLYGVYQGMFRAVGKAMATDFVPAEFRATAVGWYSATVGLTGLIASIAGGFLWEQVGPPATFFLGAGSALVGSMALVLLIPRNQAAISTNE
jgi:MFS family permease